MPALVASHSKAREQLRGQARAKKNESEQKTGPKHGIGSSAIKSQKEIAEAELNQKLAENEERRRMWLMNWHLEVDQMQTDLWDMEKTLEKSLVKTESAKIRDKENKKEVTAPKMTEEELEKLPVRMRPKPTYKPYITLRERSDINDHNFRKIIRNLHDNPRKHDVFTPDDYRPGSTRSHFPSIQIGFNEIEPYKVLLRKNPFDKNFEKNNLLLRSRTEFLQVPHQPGKPFFKPNVTTTSKSADLNGKLPSLRVPGMLDLHNGFAKHNKDPDISLPKIDRQDSKLSPVKEITKESQDKKKKAYTKESRSPSPATSTVSSADESMASDESGYMMQIKARKQQQKAKREHDLSLPKKNEPNLLDDANFRKSLIQELDGKRLERTEGNKWGLGKNSFKSSGMLKIKMPDVIKDEAKNKHHNRALDMVKERIKARGEGQAQLGNKRLSQSMGALDTIGKPSSNRKRYQDSKF